MPGLPHHVVQRGGRRQKLFFTRKDYRAFEYLMAEWAPRCGITILTYCLMPNHIHLVLVPERADSISKFMANVLRAYARRINLRTGWAGTIYQHRYWSCVLDERHCLAAVRYVLMNPVDAGLVEKVADWPHSSIRAHLAGEDDLVVRVAPLQRMVKDWPAFLGGPRDTEAEKRFEDHLGCWLPLGSEEFVSALEQDLGRTLRRRKPGRPPMGANIPDPGKTN